nr:MerR family DNA-binding transcriptional regulator [Massilia sp. JS1662]
MENTLGIASAARILGVSVKTLQRWEREGRLLPAARITTNRRRCAESQLRAALENTHVAGTPDTD